MNRIKAVRIAVGVCAVVLFCSLIPARGVWASSNTTCRSLKAKYPFGIAITFATRGNTKAFISKSLYLRYQELDSDFDGVICERQSLQRNTSVSTIPISSTTAPSPANIAQSCALGGKCKLGDLGPGGGTIYWVDERNLRYFEVAPATAWWNSADPLAIAGCSGQLVGSQLEWGDANTKAILGSCNGSNTGAYLADTLNFGGKDDWFLPGKREAWALAQNKNYVKDLQRGTYLTSTEEDADRVFIVSISDGNLYLAWKYAAYLVRPIRFVFCKTTCS
jgi:hypothetical protein